MRKVTIEHADTDSLTENEVRNIVAKKAPWTAEWEIVEEGILCFESIADWRAWCGQGAPFPPARMEA